MQTWPYIWFWLLLFTQHSQPENKQKKKPFKSHVQKMEARGSFLPCSHLLLVDYIWLFSCTACRHCSLAIAWTMFSLQGLCGRMMRGVWAYWNLSAMDCVLSPSSPAAILKSLGDALTLPLAHCSFFLPVDNQKNIYFLLCEFFYCIGAQLYVHALWEKLHVWRWLDTESFDFQISQRLLEHQTALDTETDDEVIIRGAWGTNCCFASFSAVFPWCLRNPGVQEKRWETMQLSRNITFSMRMWKSYSMSF